MRFGAMMMLAGVLQSPLAARAEASPEWAYVCSGEAPGQNGEFVAVTLYVDQSGKTASSEAFWVPPTEGDAGPGDLVRPDVSLMINYLGTTVSQIGQLEQADLSVGIFSPLRNRTSQKKLGEKLSSLTGQFRFDGGAFVPMERLVQRSDMELPGSAQSSQLIQLPDPAAAMLEVQVFGAKHKVVTTVRFDLRGGASRASLLGQAWGQAEAARGNFKSCPPAY